jgi:hypothetical protein
MTRPAVSASTERWYARLPHAWRDGDDERDWPLLRYMSLLGDQLGEVQTLLDRIDYLSPADGGAPGDTSDLVNPATADAAWLPWLAQLVGVRLPADVTGQAARDAIAGAVAGFMAGTKTAVAAAAQSALTGGRYVAVYDHSITVQGDGGVWDVLLVTLETETPDPSAVLAAVTAKRAKPAGVVLHHRTYTATWAVIEAAYPTWADRNGLTWTQLHETGM